jgi:hypothetical protein
MYTHITSDPFKKESSPQSQGLAKNLNNTMHIVLLIALSSLLLGSGGCAGTGTRSEKDLPPSEALENYLQTADHLNEKHKEQMTLRRPFVGMTLEEANLAMRQESTKLILSGTAMQAVYVGGAGVRYQLYFQGEPPRVINWTSVTNDQIELTDPDLLRPTPPVRPF